MPRLAFPDLPLRLSTPRLPFSTSFARYCISRSAAFPPFSLRERFLSRLLALFAFHVLLCPVCAWFPRRLPLAPDALLLFFPRSKLVCAFPPPLAASPVPLPFSSRRLFLPLTRAAHHAPPKYTFNNFPMGSGRRLWCSSTSLVLSPYSRLRQSLCFWLGSLGVLFFRFLHWFVPSCGLSLWVLSPPASRSQFGLALSASVRLPYSSVDPCPPCLLPY